MNDTWLFAGCLFYFHSIIKTHHSILAAVAREEHSTMQLSSPALLASLSVIYSNLSLQHLLISATKLRNCCHQLRLSL